MYNMGPLKVSEEDKEEMQGATVSWADVKEINVHAYVMALLSELEGIFTLKEKQRGGSEGFSPRLRFESLS